MQGNRKSSISVDLLVLEAIELISGTRLINHQYKNLLPVERQSQSMLNVEEWQQDSVPTKFGLLWQCEVIDSEQASGHVGKTRPACQLVTCTCEMVVHVVKVATGSM